MGKKDNRNFPFRYELDPSTEDQLIKAVRKGAIGEVRDILAGISYPDRPERLSEGERKSIQNTVMILSALLYYLSIQEGVNRKSAGDMTELYLQKAEKINTYSDAKCFINTVVLDYTRLISETFCVKGTSNTVNEVIRYVDDHICENFRTDTIAQKLGKSVPNTCRLFKSQTGITITMYMQRRKVEKAAELLTQSDMRIKDISEKIGFANQQYFEKVFRRVKGMSPKEYRQTMDSYLFESTGGNILLGQY